MFIKVVNRKGMIGEYIINVNCIVAISQADNILFKVELANNEAVYIDRNDANMIFNGIGVSL